MVVVAASQLIIMAIISFKVTVVVLLLIHLKSRHLLRFVEVNFLSAFGLLAARACLRWFSRLGCLEHGAFLYGDVILNLFVLLQGLLV